MNENRRQILEMLAAGKITADEAERLIAAMGAGDGVRGRIRLRRRRREPTARTASP